MVCLPYHLVSIAVRGSEPKVVMANIGTDERRSLRLAESTSGVYVPVEPAIVFCGQPGRGQPAPGMIRLPDMRNGEGGLATAATRGDALAR